MYTALSTARPPAPHSSPPAPRALQVQADLPQHRCRVHVQEMRACYHKHWPWMEISAVEV
jgi:hypothetical protein